MKKHSFLVVLLLTILPLFVFAKEPIRILGIGNSFTMDVMEQHLEPIMESMSQPAIMGYPYRGGTSLQQHVAFTKDGSLPYTYCEWRDGKLSKSGEFTADLISCIKLEQWDYILIQTDHLNSGKIASYEPYLTELIDIVKTNCPNKQVKLGLYMTWAYDSGSTASGFSYYQQSSTVMYDSIISCVKRVLPNHPELFLIPVGTAIQNARTSYKGERLNRDGYHLNYDYGRYIASLCWAKALCGFEPQEVPYYPNNISEYCANMCRQAVINAFISPYDTISLRNEYGKSDEDIQPGDESRLRRVTFNGLNVPIVEGQYEYTVKVNASFGQNVTLMSFPVSTKAEQNIVDENGSDVPRDPMNFGYFPLHKPEKGKTVTYVNRVVAEDQQHVTTYTFHLVGVDAAEITYSIGSREDLEEFASAVNSGQYGLNACLTQDIELGMQKLDYWKTPIGTIEHPYTGTFDGQNYTLKNFCIYSNGDEDLFNMTSLGLFGAIKNATIKNVCLTTMEECWYNANANGDKNICAGVLVGQMNHSTITNCKLRAEVYVNGYFPCGAICGLEVGDDGPSTISECRVEGTWRCRNEYYYGGFVGQAESVTILNSSSHVRMLLQRNYIGHLAGFVSLATTKQPNRVVTIENSYFAGKLIDDRANCGVSTSKTIYLGAIVSYARYEVKPANSTTILTNCHYLEGSAPSAPDNPADVAAVKYITKPNATSFPEQELTNGNLVGKLGDRFVQGPNYPIIKGELSVNKDPQQRGFYTVSKGVTEFGFENGKDYPTINLDHVTISTQNPLSTDHNGRYYNDKKEWRVYYLYSNGPLSIKADEGYWIQNVSFTYLTYSGGMLANTIGHHASPLWSSQDTINILGTQRQWYIGTTSSKEEGFLGFTRFTVNYYKLPTSISLPKTMNVTVGQCFQIGQVTPSDAYHVWSSSDESVVSVDQFGTILPKSKGTAIIYVSSLNDIQQSCEVTVTEEQNDSYTENFTAYGEILNHSNNIYNKDSLTCGLSWTLRNVKRNSSTIINGQQGIELQYRCGTTSTKDRNYIAHTDTEEGGVKAVSFSWRATSASDSVRFDVDEAREKMTKYHMLLAPDPSNTAVHTYARDINYKENAYFRVRLTSVHSSNIVVGPITITPYLLYRTKSVSVDIDDYAQTDYRFTNTDIINNTDNQGIVYSLSGTNAATIASLNTATGELTLKSPGTVKITASWNNGKVTTAYTLTITQHSTDHYAQEIELYPNGLPDSNGITNPETNDGGVWNNVSVPKMYTYLPSGTPKGTILVIPGGGYKNITYIKEGIDIAAKLVPKGWAVAVLKYRLPNGHDWIPLEDARRAMELLRTNAASYGLNPSAPFGVAGFSAGGHIASTLLTKFYSEQTRPDFGLLFYPVISMIDSITHAGSRNQLLGTNTPTEQKVSEWSADENVNAMTPPCFIALSQNDATVPTDNSVRMFNALTKNNILSWMLIFPDGGHGWGGKSASLTQRDVLEKAVFEFLLRFEGTPPTDIQDNALTQRKSIYKMINNGELQIITNEGCIYNAQGMKIK